MNRLVEIAIIVILLCLMVLLALCTKTFGEEKPVDEQVKKAKNEILTTYTKDGRPANQGQHQKGRHYVAGSSVLSSGVDTVALNTSITEGRQDVSFKDSSSYGGRVTPISLVHRSKNYWVKPLSGKRFVVVSSDEADTATVNWIVEGE